MAIALYDLSVASYLQTLGGVAGFLERGKAHLVDNGIDPQEVVDTRLFPDMLPFAFQVLSISHHSSGAIEGLRRGRFAPPPRDLPPQLPLRPHRTTERSWWCCRRTRARQGSIDPLRWTQNSRW